MDVAGLDDGKDAVDRVLGRQVAVEVLDAVGEHLPYKTHDGEAAARATPAAVAPVPSSAYPVVRRAQPILRSPKRSPPPVHQKRAQRSTTRQRVRSQKKPQTPRKHRDASRSSGTYHAPVHLESHHTSNQARRPQTRTGDGEAAGERGWHTCVKAGKGGSGVTRSTCGTYHAVELGVPGGVVRAQVRVSDDIGDRVRVLPRGHSQAKLTRRQMPVTPQDT